MSLIGTLNIGKSALAVQQAALQVTGNNIANAGNADYTRQTASISPNADQQLRPGLFIGTGVNLTAIQRQIDEALEGRLRGSISDNEAADVMQQWIGRIESIFNELSDDDLSTQLSAFFNSWSNLASKPQDIGLRQVVLQNGETLATRFVSMRQQLDGLRTDVDQRLAGLASEADQLAQQIADINGQIVISEGGGGMANGLRDQRDALLKRLSELMDIKTVDTGDGMINVMVGSAPLVIGTSSRGVMLQEGTQDGQRVASLVFRADHGQIRPSSGQLGALTAIREQIADVVGQVDELAGNLIFELNKLHSAGQGMSGFAEVTGSEVVADASAALNDPAAGLAFTPVNGSFVIHVTQKSTGLVSSTLVQVDLDGLNGDDTTLASLVAEIDGIADLSAEIVGGRLRIKADSNDVEIRFSQDSSGALAALGINTFFTGHDARDIAVNSVVRQSPALLAAARNGESGDNQTARLIAQLESNPMRGLGGASLRDRYQAMVNGVAVTATGARANAEATRVLRETLQVQREALSGVSLDEEAINLMRQQRAFQAASRLIATVDELMQTLLQLV